MNNTNNPAQQTFSNPATTSPANQKPLWKTDAFVVLALVIFWPVGLFLMYKYTAWRKWVKGLLTAFFLIGAIPLLVIWGLIFGLKGYSFIDNLLNPRVVNQSKLYNCAPINSEWGRCKNTKYNFSFEYPVKWNYIDLKPEGIGFSPLKENLRDNFIISMDSPHKWDSEEEAKKFAKGFTGISRKEEITIDGLYATKENINFSATSSFELVVIIVDGKTTYQFMGFSPLKEKGIALKDEELKSIFDHMVNSFVREES